MPVTRRDGLLCTLQLLTIMTGFVAVVSSECNNCKMSEGKKNTKKAASTSSPTKKSQYQLYQELEKNVDVDAPRARRDNRSAPKPFDEGPKEEFVVGEGAGTKLGDIPEIAKNIKTFKKAEVAVLGKLHRVMFNRPATQAVVRHHILAFSGFNEDVNKMNKTRAKEKLDTLLTVPELKQVAEMLNLLRGGKKTELIDGIADFLNKPRSSKKRKEREEEEEEAPAKKKQKTESPKKSDKKAESKKTESKKDDKKTESKKTESKKDDKKADAKKNNKKETAKKETEEKSEAEESEEKKEDAEDKDDKEEGSEENKDDKEEASGEAEQSEKDDKDGSEEQSGETK
eukprot:TRINITY_DN9_c0_g1_i1.p1 TRINITY_DN9_c0_g1~~TRINITY_DN9_c0_g1_i1.p1  ORF type:complete len:342 (-),score=187.86 TRINITY_DN9_c0_g1_i1:101-1126(-)